MSVSSVGAAAPPQPQHHAQPAKTEQPKPPVKPEHHEAKHASPAKQSAHKVDVTT
jgi:hypothetical protein